MLRTVKASVSLKRMRRNSFCLLVVSLWLHGAAAADTPDLEQALIAEARKHQGKPDPDLRIQHQLEPLVDALLRARPVPPLKARLPLLYGNWQQVWGPYDYRNDQRGLDPRLDPSAIYQSVFPGGYYYNVTPLRDREGRPTDRIGLLRGEYQLSPERPDSLKVRFTSYRGHRGVPSGLNLLQLPSLAEADQLPDRITIVPTLIVRLFFGGGYLREVYTDADLRITYGSGVGGQEQEYLYVMTRAP